MGINRLLRSGCRLWKSLNLSYVGSMKREQWDNVWMLRMTMTCVRSMLLPSIIKLCQCCDNPGYIWIMVGQSEHPLLWAEHAQLCLIRKYYQHIHKLTDTLSHQTKHYNPRDCFLMRIKTNVVSISHHLFSVGGAVWCYSFWLIYRYAWTDFWSSCHNNILFIIN